MASGRSRLMGAKQVLYSQHGRAPPPRPEIGGWQWQKETCLWELGIPLWWLTESLKTRMSAPCSTVEVAPAGMVIAPSKYAILNVSLGWAGTYTMTLWQGAPIRQQMATAYAQRQAMVR